MKEFKNKVAVITGAASGIGRGIAEGCIVNTASTAGVIIGSGSAPYSVTKHAVVALSENLYLTLKHRNALINVSVLCPGFVKTDIAHSERNRPHEFLDEPVEPSPEARAARAFMEAAINAGLAPSQVADQVFEAIRDKRFYILTDLRSPLPADCHSSSSSAIV